MPQKFSVTDHPINYRPASSSGANLCSTWGLSLGDKPIGTVWETEDDMYAGQIEGTNAEGKHREYTSPHLSFRQSVIEHLEKTAERIGIA